MRAIIKDQSFIDMDGCRLDLYLFYDGSLVIAAADSDDEDNEIHVLLAPREVNKLKDFLNDVPSQREVPSSPSEDSNARQDHG